MTGNKAPRIGGIILAAGGSSRLGQSKQLLEVDGKSLLRRAAEAVTESVCDPVIVVLGAGPAKAEAEIRDLPIRVCVNQEWRLGLSSSIKLGLKELLSIEPEIDAVVITLCDQLFVNAETIDRLTAKFSETRCEMVAAKYDGVAGVPALFSKGMFEALSRLEGDKGARDLIRDPNASVATIEMREAAIDIDTSDDIDRLKLT